MNWSLQRAHRGRKLQKQSQNRESSEAANSLPQNDFHLSCFFTWSHLPASCIPSRGSQSLAWHLASCSVSLSQHFPPNIPHKHPFPLQKALGKHVRKSSETKSKQKTALRSELEITRTLLLIFSASTLSAEFFHFSCKLFGANFFILPLTYSLGSD